MAIVSKDFIKKRTFMNVKNKPCPFCGLERKRHKMPKGNVKINQTCGLVECKNKLKQRTIKILKEKCKIIAFKKSYGKWMFGKKLSEETKKKISLASLGHKLSLAAKEKIRKSKMGNKNPNWKGGITPYWLQLRNSMKWWSKKIFERDNFTCQLCHKRGNVNAHHIESFNDNLEKRDKIWNGITLCKKCHKELHKQFGNKTNLFTLINYFMNNFNWKNLKGEEV